VIGAIVTRGFAVGTTQYIVTAGFTAGEEIIVVPPPVQPPALPSQIGSAAKNWMRAGGAKNFRWRTGRDPRKHPSRFSTGIGSDLRPRPSVDTPPSSGETWDTNLHTWDSETDTWD
jgi:hypothetical protein